MDIFTNLPDSDVSMIVIVFVDKLTKMVPFATYKKEVIAMDYAQHFIDHIYRLHGLPEVIISDQDPWFTSKS